MNDKIARQIADTINRDIRGTEPMTEDSGCKKCRKIWDSLKNE